MTRDEIQSWLLTFFAERFEIVNPGLDDDLRELHEFDSIDAIDLLSSLEDRLGMELTQDQKKAAMEVRTLNQIVAYVHALQR